MGSEEHLPDAKKLLSSYDLNNLTICTLCSHSSMQIFNGARKEGIKTLGVCIKGRSKMYEAFPLGKPDEFIEVDSYSELMDLEDELLARNAVLIPHGSMVEYVGAENFLRLGVPTFGNRRVLRWESSRELEMQWLTEAGVSTPRYYSSIEEVDRPVIVKLWGAKGGRGFFVAKDGSELREKLKNFESDYTIQEFVLGTRFYLHYFHSPISKEGYRIKHGSLEFLSIDRRIESNVDEIYKLGTPSEIESLGVPITYVVTGNVPVVIRESLLLKAFEIGAAVVEKSYELFGGMIGPFSLETICTDQLEFEVFEVSARIVAGTNPFISGSPYSDLIRPDMSTGRRIAIELKNAAAMGELEKILS
ncbi:MAG: formate--phosphoribosylaminoimidazolecarboxamide ligase [Methermicoccaceae archaeon]